MRNDVGKCGIRKVGWDNRQYPERLREIPGAPKGLYLMGELPSEHSPTVAIIGARDCSEYGKFVATELGRVLGKNDIQVISGMARGVDGIAQSAALDAGGKSFAVLGSGVDVCYPVANEALYERLKQQGGILSEYEPGTKALARNFPPRNRIVSGLADAVVVVEARMKSGTLITVDMALEQGREVYAVPGRITDRLSDGCNKLIKLGAAPIHDYGEFVEEIWEMFRRKKYFPVIGGEMQKKVLDKMTKREIKKELGAVGKTEDDCLRILKNSGKEHELSEDILALYRVLDFEPRSVEQIRGLLSDKIENRELIGMLMRLCVENLAIQASPGKFRIVSGNPR